jgi:hypothetical protein
MSVRAPGAVYRKQLRREGKPFPKRRPAPIQPDRNSPKLRSSSPARSPLEVLLLERLPTTSLT